MPVVDDDLRPIGALFEKDVRRLLLNPFGHALLRNPAYGEDLTPHLKPCPTAEISLGIADLIERYRGSGGTDGMVLTRNGRIFGVIGNRRLVHLAAEREVQLARARTSRAHRIERASEGFERQIGALAEGLAKLSGEIERSATATASRASTAGDKAVTLASAASQSSDSLAEIAGQGREIATALEEIARNGDAVGAAAEAAQRSVAASDQRAQALLRSAESIDSVIGLISDISRQVNLLALNAAIEAARAGDAGRGFTVVANEVKQLSAQTGNAAQRITRHIGDMQTGIGDVAEGQAEIARTIATMANLAQSVRGEVARQETATRTIARNVEEATEGCNIIHSDVEAIGATSQHASRDAAGLRDLASQLRQDAHSLSGEVRGFLDTIRAA
ncbi:chemotaxis protein [Sphingosinithalassobacter tenebrarum]|uniref:Chemotaxis protein n=2 Tax=Stakelama tenebrarum TaxID=2711215 RepID=A0A6G6YAP5_9SPHN|nr:chemotaxis protein [Sphingosinithalassobacter tenebrarum]